MKDILLQNGFVYAREHQIPCCKSDEYHKTVNNSLWIVRLEVRGRKFTILNGYVKRAHINNALSPLIDQLNYELETNGLKEKQSA